jgi:hypothetical protein
MEQAPHSVEGGRPWLGPLTLAGALFLTAVAGASEKPILAHYMPWFVAPPHSDTWGYHWTMNTRRPAVLDDSGRHQIASHYHPSIGPYDNADPVVLEYHVLLMKLAGIDGVIIDWYGMDDVHDYAVNERRTRAMRDAARKAGLQICLCYEDRTIRAAIDTGLISADEALAHGQQTLLYAQRHYFNDPAYLRLADGRPVLLNFGPQFFRGHRQWAALFSVLADTNQPAFFTLDRRLATAEGAFNWPPMHLSRANGGLLMVPALQDYLDQFERAAQGWPAFISSAFPRFHDYYGEAGVRASYGRLADESGAMFRNTLARAMTNESAMVQLVTWNDFGEGTVIEPTSDFGYRDLTVLQDLRRQYFDPAYANRVEHLHLARQLYRLRCRYPQDPECQSALDRVFTSLVDGDLEQAAVRLASLESDPPVVEGMALEQAEVDDQPRGDAAPAEVLAQKERLRRSTPGER